MARVVALALLLIVAGCGGGAGGAASDSEEVAALQQRLDEAEQTIAEQASEIAELTEQLSRADSAGSDETTDEAAEEAVETSEEPQDAATGSRTNPVPLGEPARVGDWEIRVTGTTPNATDQVMAENQFNDPPADGRQFFIVSLEATYVGEESGQFWADISASTLDDANVTYESFEDTCGSIPDSIDGTGEAFTGGTVTGNLCWSVDSQRADSLVMFLEPMFSFDGERVWFALR